MIKRACIYHSVDLDGWMSAAIVKYWAKHLPIDIDFIGYTYGNKIPDLSHYDDIIMCDISFPIDVMEKLAYESDLTWIDHHLSAINSAKASELFMSRIGNMNVSTEFSACELTWQTFFPDDTMPEIVRLLGRYDCFGHKGTDEEQAILEFQYGARSKIDSYEKAYSFLTMSYTNDHVCECIYAEGEAIYGYLMTEAAQIYATGVDIELEGYKFRLINRSRFNPINFGIYYHAKGLDGIASMWYDNNIWNFSLYNDNGKVDCSAIAKSFGGGGHKGASGFILSPGSHIDSFIISRKI